MSTLRSGACALSWPFSRVSGPVDFRIQSVERRLDRRIVPGVEAFRAWAEIDLDALTHNLRAIRERAGAGVRVMLVVKADAYGHGAVAVAHHAVRCGIGALGVGTSSEALALRRAGIRLPLVVLGTVVDAELRDCLRNRVHIGLHAADRCASLAALARELGTQALVHLNVDTGMGRLGVPPARAMELLRRVDASPHLTLAGVMTHVSSPEGALDPDTRAQVSAFDTLLADARAGGFSPGWVHLANSAALFTGLGARYDTVRPGISAYGALPLHLPGADALRPVLSLRSQVVFLKDVPAGTPVGYGSTWRAPRATRIATLPIGYADGVPWRLSDRGAVLLRGRRAPIVGRISMDYTTVDVGALPGVRVGDTATLVGRDGDSELRLCDVAEQAGTIPYELTCAVGPRVERVYAGGEEPLVPHQAPVAGDRRAAPEAAQRVPGGQPHAS
jgi:alanine racemase